MSQNKLTTNDVIVLLANREIPTIIPYMINSCHGGYGFSNEAKELYVKYGGVVCEDICYTKRTDPIMIKVVKELGAKANDRYSKISITHVYKEYDVSMREYDGYERVQPDYDYGNIVDTLLEDESLPAEDIVTMLRMAKKFAENAEKMMENIKRI